ncbi:unnamed protein product [Sphenostylis stenocarpa]|uniref:Uncharacterized protein n=1 Tax=Sphenostylis stenocarpa TaxID=92480 RepID=A0AA86SBV5_9FABA|nr:unnamed protein product [Sphenostylis stenocarpa]
MTCGVPLVHHSQLFTNTSQLVVIYQVMAGRKLESCKTDIVLTFYIIAMLVFVHSCVAENVVEDVAAIPPAPMESSGVHLCAQAVFVVFAFVIARRKSEEKKAKDIGRTD